MKLHFTPVFQNGILPLATVMLCFGSANAQEAGNLLPGTPHPNAIQFNVAEDKGTLPVPMASFQEMTKPTGGYKCIVDMAVFNSRLYLSTADDPLGNWGAKVFYTTDAASYTTALSDANSQGYLRMGVFDNQLWIPDGDPNGMDPGYVYISPTGNSSSFTKTTVVGAVHTFDVIKYNNKAYVPNGMASSMGGMCEYNGTQWSSVNQPSSSFRLKYMSEINGKLFVANANPNSGIDYYLWNGSVAATPQSYDKVAGSGSTYQVYTSSQGKIFWTVVYSGAIHVLTSTDGITWTPSASLDGKFVSDFAELNGKLYALDWKGGLWESSDHTTFTLIATTPTPDTFGPLPVAPSGYNADARASMAAYNGALYCGSSTTGKVYKVVIATSTPELPATSFHYTMTDHSVIFNLEKNSPLDLRVYSVHGALIKSISSGTVSAGSHEIDLSELKAGFYLLEAVVGTEVKGIKYVKR